MVLDDGRRMGAHRYSFELHTGLTSYGYVICHTCDTPRCVNPKHLWRGTEDDNIYDMFLKGRHKWGWNTELDRKVTRILRERHA